MTCGVGKPSSRAASSISLCCRPKVSTIAVCAYDIVAGIFPPKYARASGGTRSATRWWSTRLCAYFSSRRRSCAVSASPSARRTVDTSHPRARDSSSKSTFGAKTASARPVGISLNAPPKRLVNLCLKSAEKARSHSGLVEGAFVSSSSSSTDSSARISTALCSPVASLAVCRRYTGWYPALVQNLCSCCVSPNAAAIQWHFSGRLSPRGDSKGGSAARGLMVSPSKPPSGRVTSARASARSEGMTSVSSRSVSLPS